MPTAPLRVLLMLCLWFQGVVLAQTTRVEVAGELKRLSAQFGFAMRGIEQTEGTMARADGGPLDERLRLLLEDFDHVIVRRPGGEVERIIILGKKGVYVPPPGATSEAPPTGETIVLVTQRQGNSHLITLGLEGIAGSPPIQETLLIDTGAERVVLPVSLIAALGLSPENLAVQTVQTANGMVETLIGRIPAIWVGPKRVEDVEVAFIDDQRLGGTALAGMSLLGRFRMTIDDAKNQLSLISK